MQGLKVRRARVQLTVAGVDITRDAAVDLLSFTYNDNESGTADDISVSLANDHKRWSGPWMPRKGDTMSATIVLEGEDRENKSLYCGVFTIDKISASFAPNVVTISAVSVPLKSGVRREVKNTGWEDADLKTIAQEIADKAGLVCIFDMDSPPRYDRIDQHQESDLAFLNRLCREAGASLKVTDEKIAIFDQQKYETKAPAGSIVMGQSSIIRSPTFETGAADLYKECVAKYFDAKTESTVERTFIDESIVEGQTFRLLGVRCATLADAERKARAKLRELNKGEVTATITLANDLHFGAGQVASVEGFGYFDGDYLVEKASHTISSSGHTVALDMHRTIRSY